MARLDGSFSRIDLDHGYRLSAPGLVGLADVHDGRKAHTRGGGVEGATEAFDAVLAAANIGEIKSISLEAQAEPLPPQTQPTRTAGGEDGMVLEVPDLGETVGQVVMAIDNGVITWNFPQDMGGSLQTSATRGAGNTKRFVIRSRPPMVAPEDGAANRSMFAAVGKKILKVLVYEKADAILGPIGAHFARKWEDANRPHNIRRFTADDFTAPLAEPLSSDEWHSIGTGRALLFVHGTFSTAHGGFGTIPPEVLNKLHDTYEGRVFAFDHLTLSASPEENVLWFADESARQLGDGGKLDIDIVSHSRGGLVSRTLAGELGTPGLDHVNVGKLVFVATPNLGTQLADPEHMIDFIDRYTSALNLVPPGPLGVVTDALESIFTVVKVIGHAGLSGLDGLSAMDPNGEFIQRLNGGSPIGSQYYSMSSNYEPAGELKFLTSAANTVVDRVFGADNDLVVPTAGVAEGSEAAGFPIPDERRLSLPPAMGVWHSDFFKQRAVQEKLVEWLTD